ncbi:unnamed protein product [Mytilus coruscus]|uniref:Uncharacterized protein n=1 Tax=Mytilus coruscus TaxID=42192 RepID=A0A6J8EAS7_MYTCO|nr:unnamed protein product [Mytilus coruscus]
MTFTHRTLMEIFDMVPETDLNPQKRKSRALLPFIGSLSKSFFGTATMDDVNLLANHINKLVKKDRQMSHALEQHGSHISSFMKVVNHIFDKLKEGMQLNHELVNQLLSSGKNFEILMTNMFMVAFKQISKATEIQVQLVNTLSSIQSLINSKITPHLIPEHVLKKTINASDIKDHLNLKKIAKSAKKDEIIFQNLAEPLLDGQIKLDSNWPDTNGYIGIVCLFKHKSHNTTIMLEITSGGSCATIPVTSFPLCPSYWDIQPPVTIQNVQMCNFPFGKVSVEWPGFKVINKLTKQSLTVKTCFKVGLFNIQSKANNQPTILYI